VNTRCGLARIHNAVSHLWPFERRLDDALRADVPGTDGWIYGTVAFRERYAAISQLDPGHLLHASCLHGQAVRGLCGPPAPSAPAPSAPAPVARPAPLPTGTATLDERRRQLTALLDEQWQHVLRTSPVFASTLGDRRYNDRWGDDSLQAIAADLAATREFLTRFEAIDTTGFPDQEVLNQQLMVRGLKEQLDRARFEGWLMPVDQFSGEHIWLAQIVPLLPFATVKDYDDYVVRIRTLPHVLEQSISLMKRGLEKHLVPPRILLEQCVGQTEALAGGAAEDSPFAQPLHKFPAEIAAADRDRIRAAILAAVRDQVQPAYRAFAAFLRDDYVPHGQREVGMWALPDGAARYTARIKRLRDQAQTALGKRFDLRAFHDEIVGAGALPLDLLERRIAAWIAAQ
jgi:uncharacterized protein (DUF885 family)